MSYKDNDSDNNNGDNGDNNIHNSTDNNVDEGDDNHDIDDHYLLTSLMISPLCPTL